MTLQSLDPFCNWLAATPFSQVLQTVGWIVPAVQTVHILAVAAVVEFGLLIAIRDSSLLDAVMLIYPMYSAHAWQLPR